MLLTVIVIALSITNLPPVSWVIELNETIKDAWVTSPELEPPFGHAEEVSLAGIARRMDFDLQSALTELRAQGLRFDSERDSLEKVAQVNETTPMVVYQVMRRFEKPAALAADISTPEEVEARFAGTGLGPKSLGEICDKVGVDAELAMQRLAAAGITATTDDNARGLAESQGISPIDLIKIMMVPDYRPNQ